jgi:hypothetical protein
MRLNIDGINDMIDKISYQRPYEKMQKVQRMKFSTLAHSLLFLISQVSSHFIQEILNVRQVQPSLA